MTKLYPSPQFQDKGDYKEPVPNTDNVRVPRLEVDNATTYLDKDGSNNMTFTDAVSGTKTLAQLAAGSTGEFSEILLTPKESSTGTEGTMFYDSVDKCVYVGVETG